MLHRIEIVTNHQITHLIYNAKSNFIRLLKSKVVCQNFELEVLKNHLDYL